MSSAFDQTFGDEATTNWFSNSSFKALCSRSPPLKTVNGFTFVLFRLLYFHVLCIYFYIICIYVAQTHPHLRTRTDEHFVKDKKSHTYQHFMPSTDCLNACSRDCFYILDRARTKHQLRIKESLFISWLKPTLNKRKSHQYIISLSIWPLLC